MLGVGKPGSAMSLKASWSWADSGRSSVCFCSSEPTAPRSTVQEIVQRSWTLTGLPAISPVRNSASPVVSTTRPTFAPNSATALDVGPGAPSVLGVRQVRTS